MDPDVLEMRRLLKSQSPSERKDKRKQSYYSKKYFCLVIILAFWQFAHYFSFNRSLRKNSTAVKSTTSHNTSSMIKTAVNTTSKNSTPNNTASINIIAVNTTSIIAISDNKKLDSKSITSHNTTSMIRTAVNTTSKNSTPNNTASINIILSKNLTAVNTTSTIDISKNKKMHWWYEEMAPLFCHNMKPKVENELLQRIFDLAREEINRKSTAPNATCPFQFDFTSRVFHKWRAWGEQTYVVPKVDSNEEEEEEEEKKVDQKRDHYLSYLIIWKGGNDSIRAWFENLSDFSSISQAAMKTTTPDCTVTAIRDPITHFLSGYNEIETRISSVPRKRLAHSWPFGQLDISNERFEQFVTDFLSCPFQHSRKYMGIHDPYEQYPETLEMSHVYSMSSALSLISKRTLQPQYLPSLKNLTYQWAPFITASCPSYMFSSTFKSVILKSLVPPNLHESGVDKLGAYKIAKTVWTEGSRVSKSLCAMHIMDYACWTNLPDGIPSVCLELYESYYKRGVFDKVL